MAIRPNTNGNLSRGTDLPVNSTGWTMCLWTMMSAQDNTNTTTLQIVENVGSSFFADIYIPPGGLAVDWEIQAGAAYASQNLFTAVAGTWYFVAVSWVDTDTVRLYWRAFGAESLTGSGDLTVTAGAWDKAGWLNFTGGTPSANQRAHSPRMWHASLSEAELLAESKSPVPVRTANLDSAMTWIDATDAGDDESGNNRDWTVNGTLATVDYVPVLISTPAANAQAQAPSSIMPTQPVALPVASAPAAAIAPSLVPIQPVSLSVAGAAAQAIAFATDGGGSPPAGGQAGEGVSSRFRGGPLVRRASNTGRR